MGLVKRQPYLRMAVSYVVRRDTLQQVHVQTTKNASSEPKELNEFN